ncbi:MAG: metallophosphoesterase [Nanoarchaeota archaeon]|nr:metallophosphoesterase [Nanoarchaeota archaeon]
MNREILDAIREKGLLIEKEVYDLISNLEDVKIAKSFLETLERLSGQKIITKSVISKNIEYVQKIFAQSSEGNGVAEKIFVKLGLNLEITKEQEIVRKNPEDKRVRQDFQIFYADTKADKKLEVSDFTYHLRARYQQIQRILMQRPGLINLVSIGKISSNRQMLSIIGAVVEKRPTKNKNLIVKFEDLTGIISVVFKSDNIELYKKANDLQLDDVVAVKASGNSDLLFGYDLFYPDSFLTNKTKFDEDVSIAFLSDIHAGSNRHLKKSIARFLEWINSDDENAKKIKYIFFVGDNVDGVGIFPNQEAVLELKSMAEQYNLLASYLHQIPKRITMFMCPGQHDATRVAEPQPIIDRKYSEALYNIDNLILVTNPTLIKLLEKEKEFRVLMYHGASIHTFINEIQDLRMAKAHRTPAKAVREMLKRRHLAPTHSSVVYIPNADKDPLVISEVPDVLCTGEVHRLDIENYNGTLIITGSCWQAQTPFEEKVGNIPDPAKVPVLNLKTRELRIFDFGDEEEINREY